MSECTSSVDHTTMGYRLTRVELSSGSKLYLFFLALLVPLLILISSYWGYLGYPSPKVFAEMGQAASECRTFAENKRWDLGRGESDDQPPAIDIGSHWIRKGKIVVEVEVKKTPTDSSFTPRLCVVSDGQTEIVPQLENSGWL